MDRIFTKFESVIVMVLLCLMMLAVVVSTIELLIIFITQLLTPPVLLLNMAEMLEIFGFFLMVLIGLELLETIKAYLHDDRIHAEVVFLVALVAVSRKVIIMDYSDVTPAMLYGMSSLIVALGVGFFMVKRALQSSPASRGES
ncbi:phosphate-starvation-inducible PsiE family protein [bacterium]|nr:phosphate-starvation-inducible PsiE family protein [candidate division CSSED10-310 bacterium]